MSDSRYTRRMAIGWVTRETSVFVRTASDLPPAAGGVITLPEDGTYFFLSHVDLLGARFACGPNVTVLGASSENSSITSTGLDPAEYLFTSDHTLTLRDLTIKDVSRAVGINLLGAGAQPITLTWTGVNFSGCDLNLRCGDVGNVILNNCAVLGSGTMQIFGDAQTIAIDSSLFMGDGTAYPILDIEATAVISRRFRAIYSAFVAFGNTVAINVDVAASVPTDSYILDTCNFSGGGTYLTGLGLAPTDNGPNWTNCRGILNTAYIAGYHTFNNATPTPIASSGVAYKVLGVTTPSSINQKFAHTDNRATYIGALSRSFKIDAVASLTAGNNNQIGLYVAKNGMVLPDSEIYVTIDGNGRAEGIAIQVLTSLVTDDYVEIFVENASTTAAVTVTYLNVTLQAVD